MLKKLTNGITTTMGNEDLARLVYENKGSGACKTHCQDEKGNAEMKMYLE